MRRYDHKKIEKKWQKEWDKMKLNKTPDAVKGKKNFYLLTEFSYPSGNLHVGHWYAFAVPDILARALRMQGKNVLYPTGFDAFGLPAENAAIKNKLNPRIWTEKNMASMKKQIISMGTSFDWSRQVITCDPEYYKWTQWLFLQFFKNGLAYRKETAVNWCPKDKTVLANEQVVNGRCERCNSVVVQKQMLQWNMKITDYADRLIDDLEKLDWPGEIKDSQRHWIGRSEGAEIDFPLLETDVKRVVILHGRGDTPDKKFYPWLRQKLEKLGYEVQVPALPGGDAPDDEEQADYVEKHCTFDEQTAIVGHSFGGVVALRLLERGIKVKRVTLVSTPYSGIFLDGVKRSTVTAALKKSFDFEKLKKQAGFVLLYDTHDHVVPMSDGEAFAEKLGGYLIRSKAQKSHFTGDGEPDVFTVSVPAIRVFTTRADTLFGATYLVLAPEHPWVTLALDDRHNVLSNKTEVKTYVEKAKKKTELERQESKEKTGVELKGIKAINPATGNEISLWVADYVLSHYGTGAVMGVPAHDERDFEFAKKFDLPIKRVVEPKYVGTSGEGAVREGLPFVKRNAVCVVVRNPKDDTYLCINWKTVFMHGLVTGGIEDNEDIVEAAKREIHEETGYKNLRLTWNSGIANHTQFFHRVKNENRWARFNYVFFDLENEDRDPVEEKDAALHEVVWKKKSELKDFFSVFEGTFIVDLLDTKDYVYTGNGVMYNSGQYDWMDSVEAKEKITAEFGHAKKTYRLRDWIVSRQRYWGVPIPIIHCPKCGTVAVADKDLPVKLPEVKDYLPEGSGKSPLAKATKWVKVKCPQCKGAAERETDTLDTFVDSSWYFLRYTDPKNKKKFADAKKMENWMPVNFYSGGAEHTTMHLLYSRFWHKALFDLGLVKDSEPYMRRMSHGTILGPNHQKMSKSRGNVIDPDALVEQLGADTVRMYLAFIGPYNEVNSYPWNPDGVVGIRRFLERVCRAGECVEKTDVAAVESILYKTIKKVGEDIAALKFNTAISQLMILLNAIEKEKKIGKNQWAQFLKLLAPFAPHIAEELWNERGNKKSVHLEPWPKFDEKKLIADTITVAIQINGKTRGTVEVAANVEKGALESTAREAVVSRLEGKKVNRVVIVPGRLVNFVVEE